MAPAPEDDRADPARRAFLRGAGRKGLLVGGALWAAPVLTSVDLARAATPGSSPPVDPGPEPPEVDPGTGGRPPVDPGTGEPPPAGNPGPGGPGPGGPGSTDPGTTDPGAIGPGSGGSRPTTGAGQGMGGSAPRSSSLMGPGSGDAGDGRNQGKSPSGPTGPTGTKPVSQPATEGKAKDGRLARTGIGVDQLLALGSGAVAAGAAAVQIARRSRPQGDSPVEEPTGDDERA